MALKRRTKEREAEKSKASLRDYSCLRAPVITEKSSTLAGPEGTSTVAFYVTPQATKPEIKKAVERIFNVKVAQVRTSNTIGKLKRTTRAIGRTSQRKKAYVTLKPGHTINIIEGV